VVVLALQELTLLQAPVPVLAVLEELDAAAEAAGAAENHCDTEAFDYPITDHNAAG